MKRRSLSLSACVVSVLVVLVACVAAGPAAAAPGFELSGSFSGPGSDPGQLSDPQHVALRVSTGQLFVADRANDRVQIFDGATGAVVGQFGDAATTDDPFGVAVDQASGDVYVASQVSNSITKWSAGGLGYTRDLLFSSPALGVDPALPAPGEVFSFAAALAVDPASGDLLVGDPSSVGDPAVQRVQRFDSSGAFVSSFDGTGAPGGSFQGLRDVATDAAGDVYVVDGGVGGRVVRFDAAGTPDAAIPAYGRIAGASPSRVAVDPATGEVAIAVNADNPFEIDRVVAYAGATPLSETVIPPATDGFDPTVASGLVFDASGTLLASTADVCGAGAPCGGGTAVHRFALTGSSASVSLDPPAGVGDTTATLSGTLNPEGAPATYWFETSTDGISFSAAALKGPVDGSGDVAVSQNLTGLPEATHVWVRLVARRGGILVRTAAQQFTTVDVSPPDVALEPVGDVTDSGATLHARVDSNGSATRYHFEYSADGGNGWVWLSDELELGNVLDQPTDVAQPVGGLVPNHSYLTRVVATNAGGTSQADGSFDTPAVAPAVDTPVAVDVTDTSVRLTGIVNPRNSETVFHFEYGPDTGYGTSTPVVTLPADMTGRTVAATVDGLQPGTGYHFKLVADNGTGGPQETADQAFTTADPPPTPLAGGVTGITASSATVSGTVDTHGLEGTATFSVLQTDGGHSQASAPVALAATGGPQAVSATVTGLPDGGHFELRVSGATSGGVRSSEALEFATQPKPGFTPAVAPPDPTGNWFDGLPVPPAGPVAPSNVFTARSKVRGAGVTLTIGVPGAGVVRVSGKRLTAVLKRPSAKGTVKLAARLTKAGRGALAKRRSRKLAVKVTVRFTPTGGTARAVTRTITFNRKGGR